MHVLTLGPNAQAIVDGLKDRPASVIAREADDVQATFRALFNGAQSPAQLLGTLLFCGHADGAAGWPRCWDELVRIGLVTYAVRTERSALISDAKIASFVHWVITPKGWTVRMDDVAWMTEFKAATEADKATKQ